MAKFMLLVIHTHTWARMRMCARSRLCVCVCSIIAIQWPYVLRVFQSNKCLLHLHRKKCAVGIVGQVTSLLVYYSFDSPVKFELNWSQHALAFEHNPCHWNMFATHIPIINPSRIYILPEECRFIQQNTIDNFLDSSFPLRNVASYSLALYLANNIRPYTFYASLFPFMAFPLYSWNLLIWFEFIENNLYCYHHAMNLYLPQEKRKYAFQSNFNEFRDVALWTSSVCVCVSVCRSLFLLKCLRLRPIYHKLVFVVCKLLWPIIAGSYHYLFQECAL